MGVGRGGSGEGWGTTVPIITDLSGEAHFSNGDTAVQAYGEQLVIWEEDTVILTRDSFRLNGYQVIQVLPVVWIKPALRVGADKVDIYQQKKCQVFIMGTRPHSESHRLLYGKTKLLL